MNKILDWLQKNWFPVSVVTLLVFIAFASYEKEVSLPLGNLLASEETNLARSKECREDGQALLEEDKQTATQEKWSNDVVNCFYMEPQFLFNKTLNTCLYSGGYTCDLTAQHSEGFLAGEPHKRWQRHIIDVYTNKKLASVFISNSAEVSEWQSDQITEFWAEAAQLGLE